MAEIKFSIITVNLNNFEGLKKTMDSVLQQSYSHIQYIVIDGKSNDASVDLIKSQQGKINYWISEADENAYHAMNKGIDVATGDYLIFLNSGDYFYEPQSLEKLTKYVSTQSAEIYYTDVLIAFKENLALKKYPAKLDINFFLKTSLCHQTTVFSRSLFNKYGNYKKNYEIIADWLFLLTCFNNNVAFHYIPNLTLACFDPYGMSNNYEHNQAQRQKAIVSEFSHLLNSWDNAQKKMRWSYRFKKLGQLFKK